MKNISDKNAKGSMEKCALLVRKIDEENRDIEKDYQGEITENYKEVEKESKKYKNSLFIIQVFNCNKTERFNALNINRNPEPLVYGNKNGKFKIKLEFFNDYYTIQINSSNEREVDYGNNNEKNIIEKIIMVMTLELNSFGSQY